jgi:hypothetical protein
MIKSFQPAGAGKKNFEPGVVGLNFPGRRRIKPAVTIQIFYGRNPCGLEAIEP